jgi:hypothetical protein
MQFAAGVAADPIPARNMGWADSALAKGSRSDIEE